MPTKKTTTAPQQPSRKLVTGIVRSRLGTTSRLSILNDVGGTAELPTGNYRVRLLTSWYDYETGTRCIGELIDLKDIATALEVGTTGYTPEDYRKYGEEHLERTFKAAHEFDPGRVYFHEDDFIPDAPASYGTPS